jgi:hypothetical protein
VAVKKVVSVYLRFPRQPSNRLRPCPDSTTIETCFPSGSRDRLCAGHARRCTVQDDRREARSICWIPVPSENVVYRRIIEDFADLGQADRRMTTVLPALMATLRCLLLRRAAPRHPCLKFRSWQQRDDLLLIYQPSRSVSDSARPPAPFLGPAFG